MFALLNPDIFIQIICIVIFHLTTILCQILTLVEDEDRVRSGVGVDIRKFFLMHSPCPFILIWRQACARRYISSRRNINNLKCAKDATLIKENEEKLKSLLMRVKEKSVKAGLNSTIKKLKIMASRPITSSQIDGENLEMVAYFNFLGSKITVDGDCSHEIKRCLLLGRKTMTNLDSVLRSRDHFASKGP